MLERNKFPKHGYYFKVLLQAQKEGISWTRRKGEEVGETQAIQQST